MHSYQFLPKAQLTPIHELPDPFRKPDGTRVASPEEWPQQRAYLKAMLAHYLYGTMPPPPGNTRGEVLASRPAYNGKAICEEIQITCGPEDAVTFRCSMIRPLNVGKVPVITWNQFQGNIGSPDEVDAVLNHGYAIVEFDREQVAADNADAIRGPLALAYPGYTWGAIAMWAWAQSRIVDYLATTDYADMDKIVATGHSRGGKVAVCAAIYDERFAVCAANGSGCGGLGCFRYLGSRLGENTGMSETAGGIEDGFPFWWTDAFGEFGARNMTYTRSNAPLITDLRELFALADFSKMGKLGDEDYLPFDLHFLRACIAPRAVISMDGLGDMWTNTYGTQVTWRAACEVFEFLGVPENNALVMRDGPHAYQKSDWEAEIAFCDKLFYGKTDSGDDALKNQQDGLLDYGNGPAAPILASQDWRSIRLHYSWRKPE